MAQQLTAESFQNSTVEPRVRGFLHRPESSDVDAGLVLTHGAGGNCNSPMLVALAEALAESGVTVLRCNLPFRQQRSYGPPRPGDAARDREGLRNAIAEMRKLALKKIVIGGQSYGGRQASMLCAEEPDIAQGLLLLSYPLHPPGKPQQLRTQHLPSIRVRTLIVHGTRDPFASTEEIEGAAKLIAGQSRLIHIENAGHDLGFSGKKRNDELAPKVVAGIKWLLEGR